MVISRYVKSPGNQLYKKEATALCGSYELTEVLTSFLHRFETKEKTMDVFRNQYRYKTKDIVSDTFKIFTYLTRLKEYIQFCESLNVKQVFKEKIDELNINTAEWNETQKIELFKRLQKLPIAKNYQEYMEEVTKHTVQITGSILEAYYSDEVLTGQFNEMQKEIKEKWENKGDNPQTLANDVINLIRKEFNFYDHGLYFKALAYRKRGGYEHHCMKVYKEAIPVAPNRSANSPDKHSYKMERSANSTDKHSYKMEHTQSFGSMLFWNRASNNDQRYVLILMYSRNKENLNFEGISWDTKKEKCREHSDKFKLFVQIKDEHDIGIAGDKEITAVVKKPFQQKKCSMVSGMFFSQYRCHKET
eukprot:Pgem_evm1s2096